MSGRTVISVRGLGKRYDLGETVSANTLRDALAAGTRRLFRRSNGNRKAVADEFWALKDVSFDVTEGEVVGIIGHNGAGKSTLLKILSGITEPTEGEIRMRGRIGALLEVGTGFHQELSGRENIFMNGAILGMTQAEIRKKFDEIVEFAGVEQFIDTPVKRYSSGMLVRLGFAVAAHLEPEILILDEVLAVGDFQFQAKCLGRMRTVASAGRTILFVSHNLQAVNALCNRAVVLHHGSVTFDGAVGAAMEAYQARRLQGGDTWSRPRHLEYPDIGFEKLSVSVRGAQPSLTLVCAIALRAPRPCAETLVAIDISDAFGTVIMQVLPRAHPFVPGTPGSHDLTVEVSLPPLIPGTYQLSFWVGPHNTQTYDSVDGILAFKVAESPTPGRTHPHTSSHGHIVPPAVFAIQSRSTSRNECSL